MADDVSDIRLFTKLVQAGSLSEAARRLNSSPPAMSRRLAAMESRLGVRLVDRNSRRFALTEEGGILFERSLRILTDLDEAEAEASTGGAVPRGHLRIGAPTQTGRQRIAPLVAAFVAQYPKVSVELVIADVEPDLVDDELDLAFTVGSPTEPSVIARKLTPARKLVICAAPDYLARHGMPEVPDDLLRHDCIRLVRGRRVFDHWAFNDAGRRRELHVHGTLSTTNSNVVLSWALAGLGIAQKLRWDVSDDLANGRLISCLPSFVADEKALYVVHAGRSHVPPRVRAFVDFSVAHIDELRL
ncbi:LysR family transcriptional regulator [Beijerinckia sp. L45]|uniref:LysR family transcriptional regulator n=1 Tax=Beijerinckia sp. L45 TaxID=1641855 RepID=UPI00131BF0F3|nr:LysR family transcriptional regulator [Beijerinckia sp. L45]